MGKQKRTESNLRALPIQLKGGLWQLRCALQQKNPDQWAGHTAQDYLAMRDLQHQREAGVSGKTDS